MSDQAGNRVSTAGTGALLATATSASSGALCTASVNGVVVTVHVARDLTVASGDVLIVQRVGSQWFALGRAYTAAPGTPGGGGGAPAAGGTTSGTSTFQAVETRSYRSTGWRTDTDDVIQGTYGGNGNHTGCAFYGTAPRSLAGATVLGAAIHVRRGSGGFFSPEPTTMWLVTQATRPGGAPTLTSSTSGPSLATNSQNDSFGIPTSWAQSFVDGTAGGLAFFEADADPYVRFSGRSEYAAAFTLSIAWTR